MPVSIRGTAGGSVTLSSGAAAADTTLTLPNTTGTVALTASPTFSGTLTATTITSPASTALTIQSAGTTAMTVDTSQNVGIGTASPGYKLDISTASASNGLGINLTNSGSTGAGINFLQSGVDSFFVSMPAGTGGLRFVASGTNERMRIDSSGNLVIDGTVGTNQPTQGISLGPNGGIGSIGIGHASGTASGNTYLNFCYNGTGIGNISQSGTTNIAVNGTSDYRLKTNLRQADGIDVLSQIQVHKFDWVDGREDNGFIAHELQTVLPDLVVGEKDAVNEDGSPVYQMVNYIGIIPVLTKAIQELSAKNDALEARLAALEAK